MSGQDILMVLTILMFVAATVYFIIRMLPIFRVMQKARSTNRLDNWLSRLSFMLGQVFGHKRLLRLRLSGVLHFFIFSGFVVLFIDIVDAIGQVFVPGFHLDAPLDFVVDLWVVLVLVGLVLAVYQRAVIKPERYHGSDEKDGYIILGMIGIIMIGIILHESFYPFAAPYLYHVHAQLDPWGFLGYALGHVWMSTGLAYHPAIAETGYILGYLLDIGMVLAFLAYLPTSKHLHIFLAVPSIFLHKTRPHGELVPPMKEDEGMAIRTFEDMNWKDVLDLFTCTECGRCQAVCPAHAAGQPLSPKMVILELRDALRRELSGKDPEPLAGGVVSAAELWSCTTCGACQEACPVFIEHVPKIAGLRAALLEDGDVDKNSQKVLVGWDRQGNSFGQPQRKRPAWTKGLDVAIKDARKEPVDWLWFVGDFASYDPRLQELSRLVAQLLQRAGIDFGILYEGESNAGNEALRMGEYGLFETLAHKNLKWLEEAQYNQIFTTDPHSFNALRNEYRKFGFEKPVRHYTQAFLDLIEQGRLSPAPLDIRVTYHDPCYLGRWNRVFDAPRQLLEKMGVELVEMPRHGPNSFCCGAGGGRIWMEEVGVKERPADNRIREAVALPDVNYFVVACPKDMSMFSAAVQSTGNEDRIKVVDVAELLAQAVGLIVPETAVAMK
ncbi:(Fe-S)-binding protein [Sulfobacillus thermosulfidooxidans]|uniref:(Fe-S)-binding protein n=1 Tax=Sulfobacillus thermosulfidooxidans TaxID=28034 RepID=UPI000C717B29|nr:heterodisulfide reductase-related iron-sulfur binding cluster [Sulfobacillus thermosulfidooxidans]